MHGETIKLKKKSI